MVTAIIYIALVLTGLVLGSFAGATVWRIRARQLRDDKKHHEKIDQKEYKRLEPLLKSNLVNDRSRCLHCGYELKWYDLIPLVSWLTLRGKCRKCHTKIGTFEPIIEASMAAFFVLSYLWWPLGFGSNLAIAQFIVWLIAGVALAILFAYDFKWSLLPDGASYTVMGLGLLSAIIGIIRAIDRPEAIWMAVGSIGILCGVYLVLFLVSRGGWIGFGDVKLGLGLGLLLADWRLAFIALFAANLIGCIIVVPQMIAKKLTPNSRVPFGPLLIAGTLVAQFVGPWILSYYAFAL